MGKFEKYLKECIINDLSPANFNLIKDGQTRWIVDKIKSLIRDKNEINILDYGCGNMRLFNALSTEKISFKYVGIDLSSNQIIDSIVAENETCSFFKADDINQIMRHSFDIICLVNVIHEISIINFSEILGIIKLLIKQRGHLLLVDMPILPKGELLGLPYYSFEVLDLFSPIDYTFKTENGAPIIACDIIENNIMFPHFTINKMYNLTKNKRDFFSYFAFKVLNDKGIEKFIEKYKYINTKMRDEELFGYIVHMSGIANYRLVEFSNIYIDNGENEFYVDLVKLYIDVFEETGKQLKLDEVYNKLYPKYTMLEITIKLEISLKFPSLFMLESDEETLCATDRLDYFEDHLTYNDLLKYGICAIAAMCVYDY